MDAIANALTIIRNAQAVNKEKVKIPFSSLVWNILKVMKKEGFIEDVKKKGRKLKKTIEVEIKYKDDKPFIRGLKKVSKQGQRIYISSKDIRPVRNGFGRMIISTSKGVITGREAKKNKVGGEFLCKIW
jgi:small subunit ribosomal protein S8